MNRAITNIIEAFAVVAVCALLGYTLSRVPGDEHLPAWIPTVAGATIGILGLSIAPLFSGLAGRAEREASPRLMLSFKLLACAGAICLTGFFIAVYYMSNLGSIIFFVGWCVGVVAWVLYRLAKSAA